MSKKKRKIVKPNYVPRAERPVKKKPVPKELKIGLAFCAGALVLALILFFALYDDGSLPIKDGVVATEGDNWIISNLGASGNSKKYYKLGEVSAVEGYTMELDTSIKSDKNEMAYSFAPEAEDDAVETCYITGVSSGAAEVIETAQSYFKSMYGEEAVNDAQTVTLGGKECTYYSMSLIDQEDAEAPAKRQVACYIPVRKNASILVSVTVKAPEDGAALAEEELLALAEPFAQAVTPEA